METTPFPGRCGVGRVGGAQTHSTISSCNFMTASFRFVRVCCFSLPQKRRMSHSPPPQAAARPRRRSDSIASHKTIIKEAIRVAKLATPPPACKCGSGRARRSAPAWLSRSSECLHPPALVSGNREPSRTAYTHVPYCHLTLTSLTTIQFYFSATIPDKKQIIRFCHYGITYHRF